MTTILIGRGISGSLNTPPSTSIVGTTEGSDTGLAKEDFMGNVYGN